MALVSPGVSISVIDQSINIGAGPGTVPLIFIATQENKSTPDGSGLASGTTKANAGKIYSITSQRDLVQTFGDPLFYEVSGSSLNGYPLNEYGLLAAYSYLGVSNLARVIRADIDTDQLQPMTVEPTSPAAAGTYWFDQEASSYGLFRRTGTFPNEVWTPATISYFYNDPVSGPGYYDGNDGDYAVAYNPDTGMITYYVKDLGGWLELTPALNTGVGGVYIQSIWPDIANPANDLGHWLKTTSPAQGANIVLRRMDATFGQFSQVEAPILQNEGAADVYYGAARAGKVFIRRESVLRFMIHDGMQWVPLTGIVPSLTAPTQGPALGRLWFNPEIGINGDGQSTVDILIADGMGAWQNINLPGFPTQTVLPGQPTLYTQSADPRDNVPAPAMASGDIWIDTDQRNYPVIYRWVGAAWQLVNNADQTSPNGIIFTDARPGPLFGEGSGGMPVHDSGGFPLTSNFGGPPLDPDAPDSDLYPRGFLLWNTRYSTNNVKEWQSPFVFGGVTAEPDETNNGSIGRWVTVSGNNPGGIPYMGAAAQNIMVVRAIQSAIVSSEDIRAEDVYFNLIAAPGYVEVIDELLALNEDRKETAFIVGDTPFTLNSSGTSLQNWATNGDDAFGNSVGGLVSASKYFAAWYPSGLATNVDGTDVVVPPSHMALRTIAYNDQVAYPWFAPAGLQRGIVNNAAAVGYVNEAGQFVNTRLNEGQRDILYQNGINPIRVMPQGGIVVFGQKTRQPYSSATDRINVVRLENYLRYQLNLLAQPFLFEPNDTTTRKAVKDAFDRFLSELITLRGLYDFLVVCDLSNNTPGRIDRNELWIDIAIQPVKAIEFIYIPIRIKNTGSSLT